MLATVGAARTGAGRRVTTVSVVADRGQAEHHQAVAQDDATTACCTDLAAG